MSKDACELQPTDGEFRGAGTTCAELLPCSGACCFANGGCFHLPHERDCRRRVGVFQGRATTHPSAAFTDNWMGVMNIGLENLNEDIKSR